MHIDNTMNHSDISRSHMLKNYINKNGVYIVKQENANLNLNNNVVTSANMNSLNEMVIFVINNFIITSCLYNGLIITCKHENGLFWHTLISNHDEKKLCVNNNQYTIFQLLKTISDGLNVANFHIITHSEHDQMLNIIITINDDNDVTYIKLYPGYGNDMCKFLDACSVIGYEINYSKYNFHNRSFYYEKCKYGLNDNLIEKIERNLGIKIYMQYVGNKSSIFYNIWGHDVILPFPYYKGIDMKLGTINGTYVLFITVFKL